MKWYHLALALFINDLFCAMVVVAVFWYLFNAPLDQVLCVLNPDYLAYWTPWAITFGVGLVIMWGAVVGLMVAILKKL